MSAEETIKPSSKDLLSFGLVLPVVFALLGWIVTRHTGSVAVGRSIWIVGAAVSVLYLLLPSARRPIFLGYYHLTRPIAWSISTLLLLAIFMLLITPIGLLRRAFIGDALDRKPDRAVPSYWHPRENGRPMSDYFRQF
ncbi:MAG TPA: SxtJ family membrane protein [Actinomycetota bacterium]|jgi:quinol-cytochrome oxidoreductase complex cytochrome b subunit|nr:SxtJ family membrane protein [Actinomycetota bacterium]